MRDAWPLRFYACRLKVGTIQQMEREYSRAYFGFARVKLVVLDGKRGVGPLKTALNLTVLAGREISQMEAIPLIAEAGFDGCFWVAEEGIPAAEVASLSRQAGLKMEFIHAPVRHVDTLWMEGEEGEQRLNILMDWLRQCGEAQIPVMVCHVWTKFAPIEPNALGIDRFGQLLDLAQREGVKIAFENAEVDKFLAFVREQLWNHPAACFCWDTGHELCYNRGVDQLALYGDKLFCTHLNDNLGQTGAEVTSADDAHMMPFDGKVDWTSAARRLRALNYSGPLTFELKMKNKPGRHTHDRYAAYLPQEILTLAMEKARQLEKLLQNVEIDSAC